MTHYDAIVIGAGQPGPGVTGAFAEDDKQAAALIEMDGVGGLSQLRLEADQGPRARSSQASFRRGRAHHGSVGLGKNH